LDEFRLAVHCTYALITLHQDACQVNIFAKFTIVTPCVTHRVTHSILCCHRAALIYSPIKAPSSDDHLRQAPTVTVVSLRM